jgi:O-antigen/teichoic acid export membrane protein
MANYSMFAFLNSGSNLIVMKIDSLMIAALISLNSNAIYTTAFFIATVIEMPRRSISQIMGPLVADNFKSNNFAEIKSLYQKSSLILFIISVLLFIGIIANIDSLYFLIPKWREFAPGKIVVVIIGLAKIIEMVTGINGEIIVMSKYYRFNMLAITILAVFTITTNSILIPIYGLAGAAFATLLSVTVFNAIKMIFIKVKLKMVPFTFKTFIVLLLGIGVYAISTLIPRLPNPILAIIVKSIVITIIYGFVIIRFNISPQITRLFNELKGKVFS